MRELPNNTESEKIVLGSMIENNEIIPDILNVVKAQFFFVKDYGQIFSLIKDLYEKNAAIDAVSIYEASKARKIKIKLPLLNEVLHYAKLLDKAVYHAFIITEKFVLRKLIKTSTEIMEYAYEQEEDVFDLINGSIADLETVLEVKEQAREEASLFNQLEEIFSNIRKEREGIIQPSLKTINHPTFNKATGGIRNGNIIAISGNYKQGKTTFGSALLMDFAVEQKKRIGWFSLEVSEYEMGLKFISMVTKTRYGYLRDPANKNHYGDFRYRDDSLTQTITEAMRKFNRTNIFVNDTDLDINRIINKLKLWKKKHNIEIAAIDYIGLIENKNKSERRDLEIAELSRKLKRTAKELNIPIFILSQENEDGKTADSKALLRDADFWFSTVNLSDKGKKVWKIEDKEGTYEVPVDTSHFEVKNKGNRHAPAGTRILYKYHENGSYTEVDYKHSEIM